MFFFRADRVLAEIDRHLPALAAVLREIGREDDPAAFDRAAARLWPQAPAVSIDHGVMEKIDDFYVVPADFVWSDVGSWAALADLLPCDAAGNAIRGDVVAVDARDNVAVSEGRTVALLGVEGLVVVATPDAVLVVPKERAQEVRAVVATLERTGRKELL
jgi:mannose-1-phosphate guanylyltransferase